MVRVDNSPKIQVQILVSFSASTANVFTTSLHQCYFRTRTCIC